MNIEIMRVFVRHRRAVQQNGELVRRIDRLETRCEGQFADVFHAIPQLLATPASPRRRIGYMRVDT